MIDALDAQVFDYCSSCTKSVIENLPKNKCAVVSFVVEVKAHEASFSVN
jgi:hypothetical protein